MRVMRAFLLLAMLHAGFDAAEASIQGGRIENELKLNVPRESVEEVWTYLERRYEDPSFLEPIVPGQGRFETGFSTEVFYDTYFDTANLDLLRQQSGLRHRRRYFPDNPSHEKHGRELVQLKLNRNDDGGVARTEVKFDADAYREVNNPEDYHPLLGLLRGSERYRLRHRLESLGYEPAAFKPIVEIKQNRRRVYVSYNGQAFATITLDEVSSWKWMRSADLVEIEIELNENAYTLGSAESRAVMERVNEAIRGDLQKVFPAITQDQTPKYNKIYSRLDERILWLDRSVSLGMPLEALLAFFFGAVGIVLARRYRASD